MSEERKQYVYFAHPIAHYGTAHEAECLDTIRKAFPSKEVINPGDLSIHGEPAKILGMRYFFELVRRSSVVVGASFRDGSWGTGTYAELMEGFRDGKDVYRIVEGTCITGLDPQFLAPLSIIETRSRNQEKIL
jgi:hypothetical protein